LMLTYHVPYAVGTVPSDLLQARGAAAVAYAQYKADPKAALKFFKAAPGVRTSSKNAARQIKKWGSRLQATGTVHDDNAARTGRPTQLTPERLKKCITEFLAGYDVEDKGETYHRYYSSIEDAVLQEDACWEIKEVVNGIGISARQLWRRMLKLKPALAFMRRKHLPKAALSKPNAKKRKIACGQLRRWSKSKLRHVVWIDAKKFWVGPQGVSVYVDASQQWNDVIEDSRLLAGKTTSGIELNYYAAVNALFGVVFFCWVTGTTGLEQLRGKVYFTKVSWPVQLSAAQALYAPLHLSCRCRVEC
jgi:hypothetical protein